MTSSHSARLIKVISYYQLANQSKALKVIEEEIISHVLEHFENNVIEAAKFLKIFRNKIYR